MKCIEIMQDSLFLEDFDVQGLSEMFPDYEIGVRINTIYAQIARFSSNPRRSNELQLCQHALKKVETDKFRRYKYTTMPLQDVIKCFGDDLKRMPMGSFIQSAPIENYSLKKASEPDIE